MSQASFELRESRWSEGLDTYAPTIQAFADHLAGLDYRAYTVMRLASAARHFCVWLQLSKVPYALWNAVRMIAMLWRIRLSPSVLILASHRKNYVE